MAPAETADARIGDRNAREDSDEGRRKCSAQNCFRATSSSRAIIERTEGASMLTIDSNGDGFMRWRSTAVVVQRGAPSLFEMKIRSARGRWALKLCGTIFQDNRFAASGSGLQNERGAYGGGQEREGGRRCRQQQRERIY